MNVRIMIRFALLLLGFTAIVSQVVLMRELLVVFYGSELSIGFILSGWFIGGAVGSVFLGRLVDRFSCRILMFVCAQALLAVYLPLSIFIIRNINNVLMGFLPMVFYSFAIVAPACALLGFMFTCGCKIYESIGKVYILEAVGAMIGGVLVSFVFVPYLPALIIMVLVSMINLFFGIILLPNSRAVRVVFTLLLVINVFMCFGVWQSLDKYSIKKKWKGYNVLENGNSIYGNVVLTHDSNQYSFFYNGNHLYTIPDIITKEANVHLNLLSHANPKSVLLVGGGISNMIEEIGKHKVDKIDYIEFDPLLIQFAKKYLAYDKLDVKIMDARFFIKNTKNKYDSIIINIGQAATAQANRYYTVEFFHELKNILNLGAVVSFSMPGQEGYINRELRDFLACIFYSLKQAFPEVGVVAGDTIYFLASNNKDVIKLDSDFFAYRIKERELDLQYINESYLFNILAKYKLDNINEILEGRDSVDKNLDFKPMAYYYNMIYHETHFRKSLLKPILKKIDAKLVLIIAGLCFLVIILFIRNFRQAAMLSVATTGASEIIFQITLLLSFQIIYGYVFYKLSIILSSFMVGLALGSWICVKKLANFRNDKKILLWTQSSICLYPLILPIVFVYFSNVKTLEAVWLGQNIVYPILPIIAGFIGGFQFPLVNKIYLENRDVIGESAGLSYGLDLLGACLGAFFCSVFLMPILGLINTCVLAAVMNMVVFIIMVFSKSR